MLFKHWSEIREFEKISNKDYLLLRDLVRDDGLGIAIPLDDFRCIEERDEGTYLLTKKYIYRIKNTITQLQRMKLPEGYIWDCYPYCTQDVLDDHGVPIAMITFYRLEFKNTPFYRLEFKNTPKENGRRVLANPEILLKKIKDAAENDNYMWKDWNC
ncbi:hypothetical protein [Megamonas hypermegale]|uniref:hypothetical protein n=1 Tax=Megamonas hypermegale TaxID=158847 RepID=UPI0026F10555|nr:hypothetical protein [Megamonas hypermegale]